MTVNNRAQSAQKTVRNKAAPAQNNRRKVILLDGHSLAFRAFFALPDTLITSSGQVTNAVYGFTAMLIKLIDEERPRSVVVCFDKGTPRFRLDRYPEYKAGRAETPDLFRQQLPLIREVLGALRIPTVELEGYEADDLLATLTKYCREAGDEVIIVTGDRDILQLICEGVSVIMTRRGISDVIRYDRAKVLERYGVAPEQWLDFVALKGETSDNLPGIPGVGDKTAAQLVNKYGDIEQIIAHADELTPKLREAVKRCAEQVRINKELGRLLDSVALDADYKQLELQPWNDEEVRRLFTALEFRTLHERLQALKLHAGSAAPALELKSIRELASAEEIDRRAAVALAWNREVLALCDRPGEAHTAAMAVGLELLADFFQDPAATKIGHDVKSLYRVALDAGVQIDGLRCDTKIASYLLEPGSASGYALEDVVQHQLAVSLDGQPSEAPTGEQIVLELGGDQKRRLACEAVAIRAMGPVLEEQLQAQGLWELAAGLEFPLVGVLARMEHHGVLVDRDYLGRFDADLGERAATLERTIQELAGEEFRVNSQPQLQRILFEKLALPKTRKIKTGYSTDAAELEKLAAVHPIVPALLEYREVAKLKSGFTEMLLALVNPGSSRIHTTYEQTSAATGRLSSSAPNLQNIPIRGELGRQIRRAFVAPPGHVLLSADYSQIELRVLAHLSQDETFLQAFAAGRDFHAAIAAKVYGVDLAEVTPQMRNQVKQFSYGIAYGMSTFGVSQRLGIEMEAAAGFVDAYYEQFPKVKDFLAAQVEQARIDGFTTTMFGRRRYLPELGSSNFRMRALGERMALNTPIQGSAADIMKRAMIKVDTGLRHHPIARMLLTVHDELVFEIPFGQLQESRELIEKAMTSAADLRCGLAVDVHVGANWAEAHA